MRRKSSVLVLCIVCYLVRNASAQQVQVQEYVLPNGLKLMMVPKKGDPNVAAGWVAKVGSVNERPGITGLSHLFEHMMFKGTHAIGTKDMQADTKLMAEMDGLKAEIRKEEDQELQRLRRGEITDISDPKNRTAHHSELLAQLAALEKQEKTNLVPNEFDQIYTNAGASGMNAMTTEDFTVYFINVPANKLELWFWMESDRLLNPVFREFYSERDVVFEERRMRTESTPTGKFEEEFNSLFWSASPYKWPVIGWPSDLNGITREEALAYFGVNYAPNNVAACLVGDFDPAQAKALAERYLGRLKRSQQLQPAVRTQEVHQEAEKRMVAYAETNPEVHIRYHTVADGHRDDPALTVFAALLGGRTGRLYKSLVLDQKVANGVTADEQSLKWEGYFGLSGVASPSHTPEQVEQAIYREIEKLQNEKVGDLELQKVKNRFAADQFRRLRSNFYLMLQLLVAESYNGWLTFNEDPRRIAAVTADDVQRVAREYFKPENRAVALYYTRPSAQPDPVLAGLDEQDRAQINQFRAMMSKMSLEQAKTVLEQIQQQASAAPPEKKKLMEIIEKLLQEKIQRDGGK
jgi:predicted Zn-dependent peptidase